MIFLRADAASVTKLDSFLGVKKKRRNCGNLSRIWLLARQNASRSCEISSVKGFPSLDIISKNCWVHVSFCRLFTTQWVSPRWRRFPNSILNRRNFKVSLFWSNVWHVKCGWQVQGLWGGLIDLDSNAARRTDWTYGSRPSRLWVSITRQLKNHTSWSSGWEVVRYGALRIKKTPWTRSHDIGFLSRLHSWRVLRSKVISFKREPLSNHHSIPLPAEHVVSR